jgi:hypothetical protein
MANLKSMTKKGLALSRKYKVRERDGGKIVKWCDDYSEAVEYILDNREAFGDLWVESPKTRRKSSNQ